MILRVHRALPATAVVLALCCASGAAQQDHTAIGEPPLAQSRPDEQILIAGRDKRLQSEFLKKAAWVTDYDAALARAAAGKKLVFAYFTRSFQYCPASVAFESGTLSDPKFPEFARHVVPLVHVTSWVPSDPHQDLHARKGGVGFPYVAFLDGAGRVVARPPAFDRSLAGLYTTLKTAQEQAARYEELARRATAGDGPARAELLLMELELGHLGLAEARERLLGVGQLTSEQSARAGDLMASLEVPELLAATREAKTRVAANRQLLAIREEGRTPSDDHVARQFFAHLLNHAERTRDHVLFAECLARMRARFGQDPSMKRSVEAYEKRLAKLKQGD